MFEFENGGRKRYFRVNDALQWSVIKHAVGMSSFKKQRLNTFLENATFQIFGVNLHGSFFNLIKHAVRRPFWKGVQFPRLLLVYI